MNQDKAKNQAVKGRKTWHPYVLFYYSGYNVKSPEEWLQICQQYVAELAKRPHFVHLKERSDRAHLKKTKTDVKNRQTLKAVFSTLLLLKI